MALPEVVSSAEWLRARLALLAQYGNVIATGNELSGFLARSTGRIPARRSAIALGAPSPPFLSQTAKMLESAAIRPSTPLYPRVSAQLQAMLEAALTGRLGAAAAARRTAELIGAITGLPVVHEVDAAPPAAVAG